MGTAAYQPLVSLYQVLMLVTGFEPVDLLTGLLALFQRLEAVEAGVDGGPPGSAGDGPVPHGTDTGGQALYNTEKSNYLAGI